MSRNLFQEALAAEGVAGKLADLAFSIYSQESGQGRNTKTSNRGAVGGMQILPGTFAEVADKGWDINDPLHNARAGIRYLKKLNVLAEGDPALTAAGYYGGPRGLAKARLGIGTSDPKNPQAPNTLEYAQQVVGRLPGGGVSPTSQAPVGRRSDGGVTSIGAAPVADPGPVASSVAAPAIPTEAFQGGQAVPLPPELVAYLTRRSTATGGQSQGQGNAWLAFLKAMPGAAAPNPRVTTEPVNQVPDLDFTGAFAPIAPPRGVVNFNPFTRIRGRI